MCVFVGKLREQHNAASMNVGSRKHEVALSFLPKKGGYFNLFKIDAGYTRSFQWCASPQGSPMIRGTAYHQTDWQFRTRTYLILCTVAFVCTGSVPAFATLWSFLVGFSASELIRARSKDFCIDWLPQNHALTMLGSFYGQHSTAETYIPQKHLRRNSGDQHCYLRDRKLRSDGRKRG